MNCGVVKSCCSEVIKLMTVKCLPYSLPLEFTAMFVTIVYIPQVSNSNKPLKELHNTIRSLQVKHPEKFYVVAGDFNHLKLAYSQPSFLPACHPSDMGRHVGRTVSLSHCVAQACSLCAPRLFSVHRLAGFKRGSCL